MSINSLLGTARLALTAQQVAIETTSHNIANASVDGYSRQRVSLAPNLPHDTQWGSIGTGVVVQNIERIRDELLDANFYRQTTQASYFDTRSTTLSHISEMFSEPGENGLSATLDLFWDAWSDLMNMPNSSAAKSVVQQRGAQVASTLNRFSQGLEDITATQLSSLNSDITEINRITTQISDLNRRIVAAESDGTSASDLRDTRDRLIDTLSEYVSVRAISQPSGAVTVYVGGSAIVDGVHTKQLSIQHTGSSYSIQISGSSLTLRDVGGSVGATLSLLNTDIPSAKAQLNQLAQHLVTTVNTIHRTGWTAAGDALGGANWDPTNPPTGSNIDFFDPTGLTAAEIRLSTQVQADVSYIAAGNIQNGTGNNTVATQLSQLRTSTTILKHGSTTQQVSFNEYYRDLVTRIGIDTDDAIMSTKIYRTLHLNANTRRMSVSGVSTDEELIALTQHQQAYTAAARVINTADAMAQTILDLVR